MSGLRVNRELGNAVARFKASYKLSVQVPGKSANRTFPLKYSAKHIGHPRRSTFQKRRTGGSQHGLCCSRSHRACSRSGSHCCADAVDKTAVHHGCAFALPLCIPGRTRRADRFYRTHNASRSSRSIDWLERRKSLSIRSRRRELGVWRTGNVMFVVSGQLLECDRDRLEHIPTWRRRSSHSSNSHGSAVRARKRRSCALFRHHHARACAVFASNSQGANS